MDGSRDEYFKEQLNWEEHFETLDDFIDTLSVPSNSSGSLGRISARTILRLEDELKWAYCKELGSDSITGLDSCDNYKDWRRDLAT